jgi:ubiquitin C-terminal hydrolase
VEPGSTDEALVFVLRCELDGLMHDQSSPADCRRLTGMVGIENLGATCYLNALLQMLFHINAFRRVVYSLPHESSPGKTSVILALQSLFNHLQTSPTAATTQTLTRSFGWNSADAFQQQDVQEMMRVLIDKLEEYAKGSALEPALKNLFSGVLRSYIRCINIDYVSQRDEEFYDIQLDVKGFADVYASFDSYVAKELLNGDNKYDAGDERGKQDAEKGVVFRKFPPVLTIHLKRFAFDVERMCFAKIHDNFEFPTVLDLNRYLSLDDSDDQANKDANIYRLHSVLVHSGEVYGGHYYAYIRAMREESFGGSSSWIDEAPDMLPGETETSPAYQARLIEWRDRRGLWYKFDDDHVTCVTERTAVQRCYGRDAGSLGSSSVSSAYMLVYIRERDAAEVSHAHMY